MQIALSDDLKSAQGKPEKSEKYCSAQGSVENQKYSLDVQSSFARIFATIGFPRTNFKFRQMCERIGGYMEQIDNSKNRAF